MYNTFNSLRSSITHNSQKDVVSTLCDRHFSLGHWKIINNAITKEKQYNPVHVRKMDLLTATTLHVMLMYVHSVWVIL